MLKLDTDQPVEELDVWSERCEHWLTVSEKSQPKRRKRERRSHPLVISGNGSSLRVDKGTLVIRDGFTHYPQEQTTYRFFRGDLDVPTRIILIDGSGTLSFAVLDWLREQGVCLVRLNWNGKATMAVGGEGSPTDFDKLKWQIEARTSADEQLAFGRGLLCDKLIATRDVLLQHFDDNTRRDSALSKIDQALNALNESWDLTVSDLLGIEGTAAAGYFACWRGQQMNWKGETKYPVPPAWRTFDQRSSILTGKKPENYKAAHPINAMLNYAYAILEADTRIKVVANGYDPRLGILHVGKRGKNSSFVFDLMEPLRPVVDQAVLRFARDQKFSASDFVLRRDGVCRLSPQLAKALVIQVCQELNQTTLSDGALG